MWRLCCCFNCRRLGVSTGTVATNTTHQCNDTIWAGIQHCSHEDSSSNWAVFRSPEVPFPVPRQIRRYIAVHAREDLSANHSRSCTSQLLCVSSSTSTSRRHSPSTQCTDSASNLYTRWQPATNVCCSRHQAQSDSAVLVYVRIFSVVFRDCLFVSISAQLIISVEYHILHGSKVVLFRLLCPVSYVWYSWRQKRQTWVAWGQKSAYNQLSVYLYYSKESKMQYPRFYYFI